MDEKEEHLRKAIDALYHYAEDPKNPLNGLAFSKLVYEFDLARGEMIAAEELCDTDLGV